MIINDISWIITGKIGSSPIQNPTSSWRFPGPARLSSRHFGSAPGGHRWTPRLRGRPGRIRRGAVLSGVTLLERFWMSVKYVILPYSGHILEYSAILWNILQYSTYLVISVHGMPWKKMSEVAVWKILGRFEGLSTMVFSCGEVLRDSAKNPKIWPQFPKDRKLLRSFSKVLPISISDFI